MSQYFTHSKLSSLFKFVSPFGLRISGMGFSYLYAFFVSRYYGAAGFGIFSLASTTLLFLLFIFKGGFDLALLKFTAEARANDQLGKIRPIYLKIISIVIPAVVVVSLSIFLFSSKIAQNFYNNPAFESDLGYVSILLLPFVISYIHSEGLRGLDQINNYIFVQNVGINLFATLLLVTIFPFYKQTSLPLHLYGCAIGIVFLYSTWQWLKNIWLGKKGYIDKITFRDLFEVSIPMFWTGILVVAIGWVDTLILGVYTDAREVGIYNIALKVSNIVILPLLTINSMIAPKIAGLFVRNETDQLKKTLTDYSKIICLSSLMIFLILVGFSKHVLNLFGEEYINGQLLMIILCTGQLINGIFGPTDIFLQMTGKARIYKNIMVVATVLNITLNLIFIPIYGSVAAATINFLSLFLWNTSCSVYIKRKFNIHTVFFLNKL